MSQLNTYVSPLTPTLLKLLESIEDLLTLHASTQLLRKITEIALEEIDRDDVHELRAAFDVHYQKHTQEITRRILLDCDPYLFKVQVMRLYGRPPAEFAMAQADDLCQLHARTTHIPFIECWNRLDGMVRMPTLAQPRESASLLVSTVCRGDRVLHRASQLRATLFENIQDATTG